MGDLGQQVQGVGIQIRAGASLLDPRTSDFTKDSAARSAPGRSPGAAHRRWPETGAWLRRPLPPPRPAPTRATARRWPLSAWTPVSAAGSRGVASVTSPAPTRKAAFAGQVHGADVVARASQHPAEGALVGIQAHWATAGSHLLSGDDFCGYVIRQFCGYPDVSDNQPASMPAPGKRNSPYFG